MEMGEVLLAQTVFELVQKSIRHYLETILLQDSERKCQRRLDSGSQGIMGRIIEELSCNETVGLEGSRRFTPFCRF